MIKQISIAIINFYQIALSPIAKNMLGVQRFCRFEETCSEYTKRKINEKGVFFGTASGVARLLRCQPFYNTGGVK